MKIELGKTEYICCEGRYDVKVIKVEDVTSQFNPDESGFRMVMKTKDGKITSDTIWIKPTTLSFISRLANICGIHAPTIDSTDFLDKCFTVNVAQKVNGNVTYVINKYDPCHEPWTD